MKDSPDTEVTEHALSPEIEGKRRELRKLANTLSRVAHETCLENPARVRQRVNRLITLTIDIFGERAEIKKEGLTAYFKSYRESDSIVKTPGAEFLLEKKESFGMEGVRRKARVLFRPGGDSLPRRGVIIPSDQFYLMVDEAYIRGLAVIFQQRDVWPDPSMLAVVNHARNIRVAAKVVLYMLGEEERSAAQVKPAAPQNYGHPHEYPVVAAWVQKMLNSSVRRDPFEPEVPPPPSAPSWEMFRAVKTDSGEESYPTTYYTRANPPRPLLVTSDSLPAVGSDLYPISHCPTPDFNDDSDNLPSAYATLSELRTLAMRTALRGPFNGIDRDQLARTLGLSQIEFRIACGQFDAIVVSPESAEKLDEKALAVLADEGGLKLSIHRRGDSSEVFIRLVDAESYRTTGIYELVNRLRGLEYVVE